MIKILIVDDRDINRDLLKKLLSINKSLNVVAEADDGKEAINIIKKQHIDVVIMDINMPNLNGIDATKAIKEINEDVKVLTNSFHAEPFYIKQMIRAGASGYIKKGESIHAYVDAIWTVYNHGIYLSEEISESTYQEVFNSFKFFGKKPITT